MSTVVVLQSTVVDIAPWSLVYSVEPKMIWCIPRQMYLNGVTHYRTCNDKLCHSVSHKGCYPPTHTELIINRTDYCNFTFDGLLQHSIIRLWSVVNTTSHTVVQKKLLAQLQNQLQWFRIGKQVKTKLCHLVYKCLRIPICAQHMISHR